MRWLRESTASRQRPEFQDTTQWQAPALVDVRRGTSEKFVQLLNQYRSDANLNTPKVVDQRLAYMTPEWQDAFRYAASLANDLDLELAIAFPRHWQGAAGSAYRADAPLRPAGLIGPVQLLRP
jgi:hypothetical protein